MGPSNHPGMREGVVRARVRVGEAFAPGHLTALFSPETSAADPRARGSRGAGIVLELGARADARFAPGRTRSVELDADIAGPLPITRAVARTLLRERPGRLRLAIRHELPVGQGFGMSAAGALATALATAQATGLTRATAVEAAHRADLAGGGGLGGVAAILGGGLELRTRAGVPPWGEVRYRRFPLPLFVAVLGRPLPTAPLLSDVAFLRRVKASAEPGLRRLGAEPTARTLLEEAERFGERLGLASPRVAHALRALRRSGAWAGQAMFGESVYAVPRSPGSRSRVVRVFERLGARAVELRAARRGAHVRVARSPRTSGVASLTHEAFAGCTAVRRG
jgi:pantoate kinase